MAKREEEIKKKEALDELETSQVPALTKSNVEFTLQNMKKKKLRKKIRKSKSAIGPSRSQFSRSYVFDGKREKDKASVKVSEPARDWLLIASESITTIAYCRTVGEIIILKRRKRKRMSIDYYSSKFRFLKNLFQFFLSSLTRQQQQTPQNNAKRQAKSKRCQLRLLQFIPSTALT